LNKFQWLRRSNSETSQNWTSKWTHIDEERENDNPTFFLIKQKMTHTPFATISKWSNGLSNE